MLARFAVLSLPNDISRLGLAVAPLANARRVLAIDEAIFFDAANGNFNDAVLVFADDGFLGDDVCNIIADRFADLLSMAQPVAGAAIAALTR